MRYAGEATRAVRARTFQAGSSTSWDSASRRLRAWRSRVTTSSRHRSGISRVRSGSAHVLGTLPARLVTSECTSEDKQVRQNQQWVPTWIAIDYGHAVFVVDSDAHAEAEAQLANTPNGPARFVSPRKSCRLRSNDLPGGADVCISSRYCM